MAFARPVNVGHTTASVCKLCQNNEDPFLIIFCKFESSVKFMLDKHFYFSGGFPGFICYKWFYDPEYTK